MLKNSDGYNRTREILPRRFGNECLVMKSVFTSIRLAKSAQTGEKLQRLTDDLSNVLTTLKQLDKINEMDSQTLVLEVVNKLPVYAHNRWRKSAVEVKREQGN